ncbi:hypothetical protein [Pararhodospirillum oryzae]|uniref:Uncharacterized protein n=1 Tax=Pararhodospirillum oryzae TaxID=478448 RepID=A0A512HAL8_9PROT|nr:hypothetical protein [Pararhodospirillum oryzae]GEO82501.1 hypothetical protein ROR02_26320 [Pararhodospirillum oryzae]
MNSDPIPLILTQAHQELARIDWIWQAHGLTTPAGPPLSHHLAAAATLCEGWDETQGPALIAQESQALGQVIASTALADAWTALREALPGPDNGVAAVAPDLLGEAVALVTLQNLPDSGAATLCRLARTHRPAVTRAVGRACQDFPGHDQRTLLVWLKTLLADAPDLEALIGLSDALPQTAAGFDDIAVDIIQAVLHRCDDGPVRDVASLKVRMLNTLSNRLGALGRHEEALGAATKAVEFSRFLGRPGPDAGAPGRIGALDTLSSRLDEIRCQEWALAAGPETATLPQSPAARNPDAFSYKLAFSLRVLADQCDRHGDMGQAVDASREAVEALAPVFTRLPTIFAARMRVTIKKYQDHCARAGVAVDDRLLEPILAQLTALPETEEGLSPPR